MSKSDVKNPIEIPFKRALCGLHGEPFRTRWPEGYLTFSCQGFKILVEKPEELLGLKPGPDGTIDHLAIGPALDKCPMCCRLPSDELLKLYLESSIGKTKVCNACHQVRPGAPFKTVQRDWGHVCFQCVVYRFQRPN